MWSKYIHCVIVYVALICTPFSTVPIPQVTISFLYDEMYAGSNQVLTCNIQLDSSVDTGVIVTSAWRKDSYLLNISQYLQIQATLPAGPNYYQSQVQFSPLGYTAHDGDYSCDVEVYPKGAFNSLYISSSMGTSDSVPVIADGKKFT